jgi:hypothetical protein
VAPMLRVEVIPVNMGNAGEIEQSVETFARAEWRSDRGGGRCGGAPTNHIAKMTRRRSGSPKRP